MITGKNVQETLESRDAAVASGLRLGLRTRHVVMISLGGIMGAGLFVGSGAVIAATGPVVVVSYGLAGAIVFCVMIMLGELVASIGIAPFTEYTRKPLGNFAAFITGWLYAYFWIIVVAFETLVGARMISNVTGLPVSAVGLGLLSILTAINLVSVRSYGEFEFWFASIKVAAVVLFIVAGVLWIGGLGRPADSQLPVLFSYAAFVPKGPLAILASVPAVIFGICASEIAVIAAAESNESLRYISRLALSVIVRVLFFYLGSVLVIVAIVPWESIVAGSSPFVTALQRMHVPYASEAMSAVVLTAILSCLNSGIYVVSRIILGLSLKGDAPARASRTNREGVPVVAVLFGAVSAYVVLLLSSLSYEGLFTFLLNASGAVMLLIYLLIALAQLRNRYAMSAEARAALPIRVYLFPWLTLAVILAIIAVLVAMALNAAMAAEVYATAVAVAIACSAYMIRRVFRRNLRPHSTARIDSL